MAYRSFKVLKRRGTEQQVNSSEGSPAPHLEQDRKMVDLLQYWVIFALMIVFQRYFEPIVSWFPLYDYSKLAFTLYVLIPETHGSEFIFNHTVQPVFKRSESRFMRVLWPSMQTHMLKYARLAQQSIISHSLAHVSQEELSKSERDARELLDRIRTERRKRGADFDATKGTL